MLSTRVDGFTVRVVHISSRKGYMVAITRDITGDVKSGDGVYPTPDAAKLAALELAIWAAGNMNTPPPSLKRSGLLRDDERDTSGSILS